MDEQGGPEARRDLLARFLTDPDGDVFVLTGLPEVVKGFFINVYTKAAC